MEHHQEDNDRDKIDVKIKTPAGHSAEFDINTDWTVDEVIKKAEEHFVDLGQLQAGDYNLVLINQDGTTVQLAGSAKVEESGIKHDAELALVLAVPQVDG